MDALSEYASCTESEDDTIDSKGGILLPPKNVAGVALLLVHLPVSVRELSGFTHHFLCAARSALRTHHLQATLQTHDAAHISLSRTMQVSAEMAEKVHNALQVAFRDYSAMTVTLANRVVTYQGSGNKRLYLAAPVNDGGDLVVLMCKQVDAVFLEHGLPKFHANPSPHVTLASTATLAAYAAYPAEIPNNVRQPVLRLSGIAVEHGGRTRSIALR